MRGRRAALPLILILPLLVGALAAAPASAAKLFVFVEFKADASNGYKLRLFADTARRDSASLTLRRRRAYATYTLPEGAAVSARRVRANFGPRGDVDVELHERSRRVDVDRLGERCRLRLVVRRGTFRGSIRFQGERDFAAADLNRAKGRVLSLVSRHCGGGSGRARRLAPGSARGASTPIFLASCGPQRNVGFIAGKGFGEHRPAFFAFRGERTPRLRIVRTATTFGERGTFRTAPDLSTATVEPTGRFSGTAAFEDGELTGDLRVSLPGAPGVALTPGEATLERTDEPDASSCFPLRRSRGAAGRGLARSLPPFVP